MCASERTERVADLAKGKKFSRPHGINYADVLKRKKDVLQAAMDEAALANVRESMQRALWLTIISCMMLTVSRKRVLTAFSRHSAKTLTSLHA